MANFDARWTRLTQKRPALCDEQAEVTFRVSALRKLAKSFYEAGEKDIAAAIDIAKHGGSAARSGTFPDFFDRLGL